MRNKVCISTSVGSMNLILCFSLANKHRKTFCANNKHIGRNRITLKDIPVENNRSKYILINYNDIIYCFNKEHNPWDLLMQKPHLKHYLTKAIWFYILSRALRSLINEFKFRSFSLKRTNLKYLRNQKNNFQYISY